MILSPLPPPQDSDKHPSSNDRAGKDGYSLRALERLLSDEYDNFWAWRERTAMAHAYYNGDSVTPKMEEMARAYNLDARSTNLVARVVNVVLGQEEKSRRDPKPEADDDESADIADVFAVKIKEAQRETNADQAIGGSYAAQVKGGIGWCGVSRPSDPFKYQYEVESIPWREMTWDLRAKKPDLSDRAWDRRSQWKDLGDVLAAYPEHAKDIRSIGGADSYASWDEDALDEEIRVSEGTFRGGERSTTSWFARRRNEWFDGVRERVRMSEIEYRVPATVAVMKVKGRTIIVDPENPTHIAAIQRGLVKMQKVTTMQYRRAIFAGPIRLSDEPTGLKRFSRVPFVAFVRDSDNKPYGIIEGMMAPQDDYNESDMRLRWMLLAQQLIIDEDALATKFNTIDDITATMMRPDMVAVLNKDRVNKLGNKGIEFRNDFQLQRELFERMQDRRTMVQDVPGIYNAQMGNGQPGASSGIAIAGLVEQGLIAMGELNGNYAHSRRLVYENLMDLITEDHLERDMVVRIGTGDGRREVILNTIDQQTGRPVNVVKDAPVKLGLGEAPSSPAYLMQMSSMIGDMIRALAGTPAAAVLVPTWVEQTSAFGPSRKQLAEDIRKVSGLPSAQDKAGAEQWKRQQMEQAAKQAQLQERATLAEIDLKNAQASKHDAEALAKLTDVAAVTAANEDQMIEEALLEAIPGLSRSRGPAAPGNVNPAAAPNMPPPGMQGDPQMGAAA